MTDKVDVLVSSKVTVLLEKQSKGSYTAFAPALPGCISEGDSRLKAIENIKQAIELYLEDEYSDQKDVKPEYAKKLEKIRSEKMIPVASTEEFRKRYGIKKD